MPENVTIAAYNIPDELQEMEGTDESKINEKLLKVLVVEQGKAPYVTEIRNGYKELQKQVGGAFTTIGNCRRY